MGGREGGRERREDGGREGRGRVHLLSFLSPRSAAESTEDAQPEQPVQQPTVIQANQGGEDLLIGDLLSLDIPTGPSAPVGGLGGDLDLLAGDLGGLGVSIRARGGGRWW